MSTLIMQISRSGKCRRCTATCYNAAHKECKCICNGMNYGMGLSLAVTLTELFVKKIINDQTVVFPKGKPEKSNYESQRQSSEQKLPPFQTKPENEV